MLSIDLILIFSHVFCYFAYNMKKYRIELTEVLSRVEIVAEDDAEAMQIAKAMYRDCELMLDTSDYVLTEFSVIDE